MPRKYIRKTTRGLNYTHESLREAVNLFNDGIASLVQISREFNIPRNTIRRHAETNVKPYGGRTIFSHEQEEVLKDRIVYLSTRGFPLTILDVRNLAFHYAKKLFRRKQIQQFPKWQTTASLDWWDGFRNRHTDLSTRIAENISTSRAEAFNEQRVNTFFEDVRKVIEDLQIEGYPQLHYNCDETGLSSVPNSSKRVIAKKGAKIVQKIQSAERGTLTTLLPCVNAVGNFIPPLIIFKGQHVPNKEDYPNGTKLFGSKSGYINEEIFLQFLIHFDEHREKVAGKKVLLFLDGHASHLTVEALEFCQNHSIELICLPPHSSHRLQPLDTNYNKPLKNSWSSNVSEFLRIESKVTLTKWDFGKVFSKVWSKMVTKNDIIISGFNYCGLYPFRNPTQPNDFNLSKNYGENRSIPNLLNSPETSLIRSLMPSPQKEANPAHSRKHTAHVSTVEEINRKQALRRVPNCNVPSTSKAILACEEGATSETSKTSKPVKRKIFNNERPSPLVKHQKNCSSAESSFSCCVCNANYSDAVEDWMQCTSCLGWACETCFKTDTCGNC